MRVELAGFFGIAAFRVAGGVDLLFQIGEVEKDVAHKVEIDLASLDRRFGVVFSWIVEFAHRDHRRLREQFYGLERTAEFFDVVGFGIEEIGIALDENGDVMLGNAFQFLDRGIGVAVDDEDIIFLKLAGIGDEAKTVAKRLENKAESIFNLMLEPGQLVVNEDRDHAVTLPPISFPALYFVNFQNVKENRCFPPDWVLLQCAGMAISTDLPAHRIVPQEDLGAMTILFLFRLQHKPFRCWCPSALASKP